MNFPIRERLEAHAAACREALAAGRARPMLPKDVGDELWRMVCAGERARLVGARLDGANLDGASLDGARLDGANLDGASLDGARLDGANLDGASLDGARLDGASLVGASLVGANLVGASLDGARLDGAILGRFIAVKGEVRTITGCGYAALTVPTKDGRILRFGCETRTLADWRETVAALCVRHEPSRAAYYEDEIRALLAYCDALDARAVRP